LVGKAPLTEKLSKPDEAYIYSRPVPEQQEILDAMYAWEQRFPEIPLPTAAKLNEWLQGIRDRDSYWKGTDLIRLFDPALQTTQERKPKDVIGWLTAGFREGYVIDSEIFGQ
jgi:hypothetical protein